MAIRTAHNPFNLVLATTISTFAEKKAGRGRPQTNSYLSIDLSGVADLCGSDSETKRIRNEAFKLLRNELSLDPKTPIVPNLKSEGNWIVKSTATGGNLHVVVTSVTPEADTILG